jgi:hypothetical protein
MPRIFWYLSGSLLPFIGLLALSADAQTPLPMVLAISTTTSGATLCLPLIAPFNVSIRWGDGTWSNTSTANASCTSTVTGVSHRYASATSYTISIYGRSSGPVWLKGFGSVDGSFAWSSSVPSITLRRVDSFGELGISTLVNGFRNTPSLTTLPTVLPSTVTSISGILAYSSYNGVQISSWNTSRIVDISLAFYASSTFNQPLNGWDVSNVVAMYATFSGTSFNNPLSSWNTSRCRSLQGTFYLAASFNQDISGWDVSRVTVMTQLFQGAAAFNRNLTRWCVPTIRTQPANFANSSALQLSFYPKWGTCGGVVPPPLAPPLAPPVRPPMQAQAPVQNQSPLASPVASPVEEENYPPLQTASQLCRDELLVEASNVTCIDGRYYYYAPACSVFGCVNSTTNTSTLLTIPSKSSIIIFGNATVVSTIIVFELEPLTAGLVEIDGCVNLTDVSLAVNVNSTAAFVGKELELLRFGNPICSSTSGILPDVEIATPAPDSDPCSNVKASATIKQLGAGSKSIFILFSLDSTACAAPRDQQTVADVSGVSVVAVAIGVTAAVAILVIVALIGVHLIRRKRNRAEKQEEVRSKFESTGDGS